MSRVIALDVGDVRIGVAVSDPSRLIAQPVEVYRRVGYSPDCRYVLSLAQRFETNEVLLGLPLNMDGTEGPRCQSVRQFVTNIQNHGSPPLAALPIVFQDERLSTAAVTRGMIDDYDMTRSKRAERIDAAAAAWILESLIARLR